MSLHNTTVLFVIGLASTVIGIITLFKYYVFQTWALATGKILKAEVKKTQHKPLWAIYLEPDIEYEYSVNGESFKGSKIASTGRPRVSSFFGTINIQIYPVRKLSFGDEVKVYYNPVKPSESFLKLKGLHFSLLLNVSFLLFGLITLFFSIIAIVEQIVNT